MVDAAVTKAVTDSWMLVKQDLEGHGVVLFKRIFSQAPAALALFSFKVRVRVRVRVRGTAMHRCLVAFVASLPRCLAARCIATPCGTSTQTHRHTDTDTQTHRHTPTLTQTQTPTPTPTHTGLSICALI